MKVYEMELKNFPDDDNGGETLWIATDKELVVPDYSSITNLHEIGINPNDSGIDLIIK